MAAGLGFKDFTTGEVLTAADVDGYLMQGVWVFASAAARDAAVTSPQEGNFAYLKDTNVTTYYTGSAWANLDTTGMTNPMTTTGDIIYSSPGSTPVRLGIGSTGNVLTVASGVPSWAAPAGGASFVGVSVYRGSAKSIANNTETSIDFDNEYFDTDGFHDNVTNNTRLTVPSGKGGYYLITATLPYASNASGERQIILNLNGADNFYFITTPGAQATTNPVSIIKNLTVGDYVELQAYQSSGGALNCPVAGSGYNHFSMYLLGA